MAAGSNVETVSAVVSGDMLDIVFAISTSGRQEDGWAIIMDSSYQEVLRSDYFRVYGNSSTSKSVNISSLPDGNYYAGFYSDEWGGMSPSMQPFTKGNPPLTTKTNLYGSVDNKRKMVRKLYGSVNGAAKEVVALYGSVNGVAKQIFPVLPYGYVTYYTDSANTTTNTVEAWTMNEVNALASSVASWSAAIDGVSIDGNKIKEVRLTKRVTNITASNWLAYTDALEKVDLSETSITNVGNGWFYYGGGEAVNVPNPDPSQFTEVKLPDTVTTVGANVFFRSKYNGPLNLKNVTTIGNYFLREARRFNGQITTSSSPVTIGNQFMYWCMDYNKPLTLPAGSTFGDYFMASCFSFNSALGLSGNVSAGNNFMDTCNQFNQNLNCTFTNIGNNFLNQCHSFNKSLTITASSVGDNFMSYCQAYNTAVDFSRIDKVGNKFMEQCDAFNKPVTLRGMYGLGAVGDDFLYGCDNFNSNVDIGSASSVGNNFMNGCVSFNARVTANYLHTVGNYFMANCTAYTTNGERLLIPQNIGDYCYYHCSSLNCNPSFYSPTSSYSFTVGNHFMEDCGSSIGTVWLDESIFNSVGTHFLYKTSFWKIDVGSKSPTNFSSDNYSFAGDDSPHSVQVVSDTTAVFNQWLAKFPKRTALPYRDLWESDF